MKKIFRLWNGQNPKAKKKEIKEVFKSLKEHIDNALKEVKKDYNI
jgi:hypothetical protein